MGDGIPNNSEYDYWQIKIYHAVSRRTTYAGAGRAIKLPTTHCTLIIISFSSPTLSFIPDLKPSFSANPSQCSLSSFFRTDYMNMIP